MYQRVGKAAYKADLNNTLTLAEYLNHPERGFKSIHVAGTNGKGSTSHMLASILQEAGYKVGLYTSPHLKDFRERIKINGRVIPKTSVIAFVKKHKEFFESHQLSFFEMTVGMAFDFFRKENVDIAVIEVGMGGRLDSTNIITPEVSVITNIGMDHVQFLGNTLPEIAAEKAGIIKKNIPVVIGETHSLTQQVFVNKAKELDARIVFADQMDYPAYDSDLKGAYQVVNQRTVLATIDLLNSKDWEIPEHTILQGLLKVEINTGLMGRWQILKDTPKVICDTAHNAEGLKWVMHQLVNETFQNLHIVLGVVSDKDLKSILPLFPSNAQYYFCEPSISRALPAKMLKEEAKRHELSGKVFKTVENAYKCALETAQDRDLIFVGGSTFVVAEVL